MIDDPVGAPRLPLLTSHELARWLLDKPDLPVAYRGPEWCINLPAVVTHAFRAAFAPQDSVVERLDIIVIEANPDHQLKEIPRGQPDPSNQTE